MNTTCQCLYLHQLTYLKRAHRNRDSENRYRLIVWRDVGTEVITQKSTDRASIIIIPVSFLEELKKTLPHYLFIRICNEVNVEWSNRVAFKLGCPPKCSGFHSE